MAKHHELRQLLRSNEKRKEGSDHTSCTLEAGIQRSICARMWVLVPDMRLAHILDELGNMWCSLVKPLSWQLQLLTGSKTTGQCFLPYIVQLCHENMIVTSMTSYHGLNCFLDWCSAVSSAENQYPSLRWFLPSFEGEILTVRVWSISANI